MFGATFLLNTLIKGQQNSNQKSKSELTFEFKMDLIEFVPN
jgi:hypothetical protein